jgi:hypothetical protein
MTRASQPPAASNAAEFADALRKGVLLGAAVLVLVLPPAISYLPSPRPTPAAASSSPPRPPVIRRAEFGPEPASPLVRKMANWVVDSRDNRNMSFVIIDKTDAKVFVFNPAGRLKAAAPALLGEAIGDDSVPGIGDKPLSRVLPQEKTTPAGRFIAEVGMSTRGEDVVWVDYEGAVSMHRVLKVEQRIQRLASPTPEDNRMSFGCINLPPQFYEHVLRPTVDAGGAIIYILPETRSLRQTFASYYDVDAPLKLVKVER